MVDDVSELPEGEARRERISARFDLVLSILAFVMLGLLIAEFAADVQQPWSGRIAAAQIAIWIVFVGAFLVELAMAPSKWRYIREHWLVVLSLALPFLRIFRIFRAVRVLRAARLTRGIAFGRTVGTLNRVRNAAGLFAARSHLAYIALLTLIVTVTCAAAVHYFERATPGASIGSFPDALWWAATVVTTVNGQDEAVSLEGRLISLLLRIFGIAVSGYLTAQVAVLLLGRGRGEPSDLEELRGEVRRLADTLDRIAERDAPLP